MKYRTSNQDAVSKKNVPVSTLIEVMLQDAFLTNYKIGLGIIDEIIPNESDNKLVYAQCKVAVQKQNSVSIDGIPQFKDYTPVMARIIRWGNNEQPITTNIIKGQLCLLLFTDRPFDNAWTQQPNEETGLIDTVPLSDYRAHNMGDCICIPFSHDVPLTEVTTIKDDVNIVGNLSVDGNVRITGDLIVEGNIIASHIEAEDGFTGTKTGQGISVTFNKGICTG